MTLEAVSDDTLRQRCAVASLRQKDISGSVLYEEKQWYPPLLKTASGLSFYMVDVPIDLLSIAVGAPVLWVLP